MRQTICWFCRKSGGGCSWSAEFKPVKGWKAEHTIVRNGKRISEIFESYKVIECPKFEQDRQINYKY